MSAVGCSPGNTSSRASPRSVVNGLSASPACSVKPRVSFTVVHRRARNRLLSVTTSTSPAPVAPRSDAARRVRRRVAHDARAVEQADVGGVDETLAVAADHQRVVDRLGRARSASGRVTG